MSSFPKIIEATQSSLTNTYKMSDMYASHVDEAAGYDEDVACASYEVKDKFPKQLFKIIQCSQEYAYLNPEKVSVLL